MKILAIGDVHGKTTWKNVLSEYYDEVDEVIFLGDYTDSHFISDYDNIYSNLEEIIKFAKSKNNVTLLLGNHDFAYIHDFGCSGKKYQWILKFQRLFKTHDFKICKIIEDYFFSHAGLTNSWFDKYCKETDDLENFINDLSPLALYSVGDMRGGNGMPGPLWTDIRELMSDYNKSFNYVIGHTPQKDISKNYILPNNKLIFPCDLYDKENVGYKIIEI